MAIVVRPRVDGDLGACEILAREVRERDGYPPHRPRELGRFLAAPDALGAWVAVDSESDDLIGHVALHRTSSDEVMEVAAAATGLSPEQLAVVARLFVAPQARNRGAGGALLDAAAAAACELGLLPVLDVAAHFTAAVALYERHGWRRVGEVRVPFRDLVLHELVYVLV